MAVRCAYEYNVSMTYISSSNTEYNILSNAIKYVHILHDYDNELTPWILCMVSIDADIYNKMRNDQADGRVSLTISKMNIAATSSAYVNYIQDQFLFFLPDSPNPVETLDESVKGKGIAYKTTPIGLFKKELIDQNQKHFCGIYKNTTMSSIIVDATSHMNMLIEPLKFNTEIVDMPVPEMSTVAQFISYLNYKYNFYGDQYMYFMDFDKTYLKSNSGRYLDAKDGHHPFVAIDIRNMTELSANLTGVVVDDAQDAYVLFVDSTYVRVDTDRITPQIASNIVVIDPHNGNKTIANVDTSSIVGTTPSEDASKYITSDDPNAAKYIANTLQNTAVTIVASLTDVDASILTPNKEYLVSNYQGNPAYTGRYYLSYKQEVFYNTGMSFVDTTHIGLRMVVHY